MDQNAILLALGGIGAAALLSQWLAWRLRLPAILFLLLSGIVAGPPARLARPGRDVRPPGCSRWYPWRWR
ncbi:putative sodium/hydrogen antiporter [Pseudomonas aeruginosa]|nr:putative sodium/hydrogen antiporter [Pseudomonas aeruginosa]